MPSSASDPSADPGAGYASARYAESLAAYGRPLALPACGGWLLERDAPGGGCDAMGCYPVFSCTRWAGLADDLACLAAGQRLISVTLVLSPFTTLNGTRLQALFPDRCDPFKEHHVVDLARAPATPASSHHRRNLRAAARRVEVERLESPARCLDVWTALYDNLIQRHAIRGIARFGRDCFARQLTVPGLTAFRAVADGETVGMALWIREGADAFYHLAAYSEAGYRAKASFAIFHEALAHLRAERVERVDLGAGAGRRAAADDGLNRFKRGWANETRPAWLCGRILDADRYARLAAGRETAYFPAYREGEFA